MKFTTARRIIKEAKKGKWKHPPELVARAHEVCAVHHAKVAEGEKFKQVIIEQTKAYQEKLAKELGNEPSLTGGLDLDEFAERQVKMARRGDKMDPKLRAGKVYDVRLIDPMGNKPIRKLHRP